jgi:hypothetical protein
MVGKEGKVMARKTASKAGIEYLLACAACVEEIRELLENRGLAGRRRKPSKRSAEKINARSVAGDDHDVRADGPRV